MTDLEIGQRHVTTPCVHPYGMFRLNRGECAECTAALIAAVRAEERERAAGKVPSGAGLAFDAIAAAIRKGE